MREGKVSIRPENIIVMRFRLFFSEKSTTAFKIFYILSGTSEKGCNQALL